MAEEELREELKRIRAEGIKLRRERSKMLDKLKENKNKIEACNVREWDIMGKLGEFSSS